MSGGPRNSEKPYNKLTVGIALDSWGVWFSEDGKQVDWQTFLDEVAEVGYEVIETGPLGFLPTDPEVLQAECTKHGIRVVAGTQLDILYRPKARRQTERGTHASASVLEAIGAHHLAYLPPMLHDLQVGGWIEDLNLSDTDRKLLAGNAGCPGKLLRESCDVTMVVHPRGDPHIENRGQTDRFFIETGPEHVSSCLDTEHLECSEMNTADLIRSYLDRIGLVYIKQMDLEVVQRVRRENLSFGEAVSPSVCVTPDTGRLKIGAVTDALAALGGESYIIVGQDLCPCTPDISLPLAIGTRKVLAGNHLGTH